MRILHFHKGKPRTDANYTTVDKEKDEGRYFSVNGKMMPDEYFNESPEDYSDWLFLIGESAKIHPELPHFLYLLRCFGSTLQDGKLVYGERFGESRKDGKLIHDDFLKKYDIREARKCLLHPNIKPGMLNLFTELKKRNRRCIA